MSDNFSKVKVVRNIIFKNIRFSIKYCIIFFSFNLKINRRIQLCLYESRKLYILIILLWRSWWTRHWQNGSCWVIQRNLHLWQLWCWCVARVHGLKASFVYKLSPILRVMLLDPSRLRYFLDKWKIWRLLPWEWTWQ